MVRSVAHQAPLSMEFSKQEYWSGLPFPSPRDLSDPGIKSRSLALQGDSLPSEPPGSPVFVVWIILFSSYYEIYLYSYMINISFLFIVKCILLLWPHSHVLFIRLLMDIWVVSSLELSQIRCHEHLYMSLNGHALLILLGTWKWNDHVIW